MKKAKKMNKIMLACLMGCLVLASVALIPGTSYAKTLSSAAQVKKLAQKKVKGAKIDKVKKDRENGVSVYEVKLSKGKKSYDLVYRVPGAKLISYEWKTKKQYLKKENGTIISKSKCKKLARKQVSKATVTSIAQKSSNGLDIYKVKMKKSNKKYELKFNAHTGDLIEYEWELVRKAGEDSKEGYISEEDAMQIALKEAGGGTVVKIKFKKDDGIYVYKVEVINGQYEYEIEINAETGKVLDVDRELIEQTPSEEDNSRIGLEAAKDKALADAGQNSADVTYTKAELDYEDGIPVYEIEFYTADYKYEYEINALTGAVLKREKEVNKSGNSGNDNPGNSDTGNSGSYIGEERAKTIALDHAGFTSSQVRFSKAEFDYEDGIPVYEVEFYNGGMEYEYEINAITGSIVKFSSERDD